MLKLMSGRALHAVAGGPAVGRGLWRPAEPQQLRRELFDEVHQPGDAGFLRFISTAERHAGYMNMQATSARAVTEVTELLRLVHNVCPRAVI